MKLKKAATNFDNICSKKYKIIVAKKGKTHNINLTFERNQFFHLLGIQHLNDINTTYNFKNTFFKNVMNNKINMNTISKSCYYNKWCIEDRIEIVDNLEKYLDSDYLKFGKYINNNCFSKLEADYIFIKILDPVNCNIFAKKRNNSDNYCLNSCNKNNNYISKATSLSVIYKEKIDIKTNESFLFINKLNKK